MTWYVISLQMTTSLMMITGTSLSTCLIGRRKRKHRLQNMYERKRIWMPKKGHPQPDHKLEKQSSAAKRQENQQSKSKSTGTKLKVPCTSQRKQELKVTFDSIRQTRSSTKNERKVPPDTLNKTTRKESTVHASPSKTRWFFPEIETRVQ